MEKQYEDSVITALENSFGAIEKDKEFQMNIFEIAGNVVQDNISDYIEMLNDIDDGSLISFDEDKESELQNYSRRVGLVCVPNKRKRGK